MIPKEKAIAGNPPIKAYCCYKICSSQTWYGLSDYQVEERVNDSLSFSCFWGMLIEQAAPDHSTISRFRTHDVLLEAINPQLEPHAVSVKTGAIVDASVVDSPLKPKGKAIYLSSSESFAHAMKKGGLSYL